MGSSDAETVFQQALALHRQARFHEAETLYRRTLQLQPHHFDATHMLGVIALQENQAERAVALLGAALSIDPLKAPAHVNHGLALYRLSRYEEALRAFDQAIALQPAYPEACFNRGNSLRALGRHAEAAASYDQAVMLKSDYADAYLNRGLALADVGQPEEAIASFDRAVECRANYAAAHFNCGNVLLGLKRYEAALARYERAVELQPLYAEAHLNRGSALVKLRRYPQAVDSYNKAIIARPGYTDAFLNRGGALKSMDQLAAAVASYDGAIARDPNRVEAYSERGHALRALKNYAAAGADFDRALALRPGSASLRAIRRHVKMQICDWTDFAADAASLGASVERGESVSVPFFFAALLDSAPLQKRAAENWVREECPPNGALGPLVAHGRGERIRVGYFSADLHAHATAYLIAGLLEAHDRSRFEITAFSFGPDPARDEMRKRLRAGCEHFIDVRNQSDVEVATLARNRRIDIAVDLKGFTQDCRPDIFALRAAPIQVNYLGYPGTMGAPYMDYLLADAVVVPEHARAWYAEKIVYLPDSYQVNDARRAIAERVFTRAELGLPPTGFVFCCFNNCYKITPATFDSWLRLLQRVPGSVLWLLDDNLAAVLGLRREAERHQVDTARLVFAERLPLGEHLARYRVADLFLDTLPFNAHTTASDALWAGLPVLTCAGESFGARVAASLLAAAGLPELITTTPSEYEELAVHLAHDGQRLGELRQRLADHRSTAPLFATQRYATHLEEAYTRLYEHNQAGLAPEHLDLRHP